MGYQRPVYWRILLFELVRLPLELVELLQPVVYYLADLAIARSRSQLGQNGTW
jgi:hypothetical protein